MDDFRQYEWCAVAVLDVGGVDYGMNEIAVGIGEDVALASLGLLARVVAARSAAFRGFHALAVDHRSEEHTSELQSLMRISYAVFCLKKKKIIKIHTTVN